MTKQEIVANLSDELGLSKKDASTAYDIVISKIIEGLKVEKKVAINGLGTFTVKERAAREGRNPATGETITIPASINVGFKVAKVLKDDLNK